MAAITAVTDTTAPATAIAVERGRATAAVMDTAAEWAVRLALAGADMSVAGSVAGLSMVEAASTGVAVAFTEVGVAFTEVGVAFTVGAATDKLF
jgi:hypothetical protein